MTSLYERLSRAGGAARRATATTLIDGMRGGYGYGTNVAYMTLCEDVIAGRAITGATPTDGLLRWEFSAYDSTMLLRSVPRVSGFLNAIARAPEARGRIIDAGCGATAILSVGAAIMHPKAEVVAYEINEPSAACARGVVELLGLEDRIDIRTADALAVDLPQADIGVTETFCSGLTTELGHKLTAALAGVSRDVIPAVAIVSATDQPPMAGARWQHAASVDLTSRTDVLTGHLRSTEGGNRDVSVYAAYYDGRGDEVIAQLRANNLTNAVTIGSVPVARAGVTIGFSYEMGSELHETPAMLWTE
jgi:hypothetical protein